MNLEEIDKELKSIRDREKFLLEERKKIINSSKFLDEKSYNNCSKIAYIINSIYLNKENKEKQEEFILDAISLFCRKSKIELLTIDEMIDKLNRVESVLSKYLGENLNKEAREYFLIKIMSKIYEIGIPFGI